MKRAFTMVELIMTIVIMGILSGGTYISLSHLYTKSAKSKAISELSFDTTLISNQISALLYHRVPATVIGFKPSDGSFESIYNLSKEYEVLEWIGTDFESYRAKKYSSFIDFVKSDKDANMTYSPDTQIQDINSTALMFSGAYDEGIVYGVDFNDSFGWYGNGRNLIYDINETSTGSEIILTSKPSIIYEKYYLLKSAYAITKYEDINATCLVDSNIIATDKTLLFFYDYYPWRGETFCQDGRVTVLSNEAKGFEIDFVNGNLQFNLTLEREIRKRGKNLNIQISKQKVVF